VNAAWLAHGRPLLTLPPDTMIGALMHYITHADPATFQPMKANFGLMPPLETRTRGKRARGAAHAERALASLDRWIEAHHPL
jgi:methylenetetrahydrofolate--tRNA-(uracil-5-)-methyltransferase